MANLGLQKIRSLFVAPQLLHEWEMFIGSFPAAATPPFKEITQLATSVGLPTSAGLGTNNGGSSIVDVKIGGYTLHFNGKEDRRGSIAVGFVENINADITKWLNTYFSKRQEFTDERNISLKSVYDKDLMMPIIELRLKDQTSERISQTFKLINCSFSNLTTGAGLGQDAETMSMELTIEFDSYVVIPNTAKAY